MESSPNLFGANERPISDKVEPAGDPRCDGRPLPRSEHGGPVVDAAGGGVNGAYLGERGGDGEGDERNKNPAIENRYSLPVGEGDVECCAYAEGDGHDGKRPGMKTCIRNRPRYLSHQV